MVVAKITEGCTGGARTSTHLTAFNWLAANAPAGTIVNWSHGYGNAGGACTPAISNLALENAIRAAHDAGVIVVVAAGNDGCNTADFSPAGIPEAFVVGSTGNVTANTLHTDARSFFSRTGTNISGFSPGYTVNLMGSDGTQAVNSGTSFSAPYVAGVFAVACEAAGTLCDSGDTAALYGALRDLSPDGVILDEDRSVMTGTTSRFISQQW